MIIYNVHMISCMSSVECILDILFQYTSIIWIKTITKHNIWCYSRQMHRMYNRFLLFVHTVHNVSRDHTGLSNKVSSKSHQIHICFGFAGTVCSPYLQPLVPVVLFFNRESTYQMSAYSLEEVTLHRKAERQLRTHTHTHTCTHTHT